MANITTANNFSEQKQEGTVQVKQEKKDDSDTAQSSSGEISNIIVNNPQLSQLQARNVTITVAVSTSASSGQSETIVYSKSTSSTHPKPATLSAPSKKAEEPPPIDFPSICGSFGWTTIGTVHLPFIMRGEDRFVAVRMVESKIISKYADILPWTVFTCTNIKSYYITENEAKLFNEINGYHCEFQFGYQTFSAKDVVVRLGDTVKFYEFLESCRTKLHPHGGGHPAFKDKCGFIMVNCTAVPYLSRGSNKYVPLNMVYPEGVSPPVPATEKVSEWDLAYLRFLCFVANLDQRKLKAGIALCCLEELQNALGLCFEEWWPSLPLSSKSGRTYLSSPSNGALPKWGGPLQLMQASSPHEDSSHKLRDNVSEVPVRENVFNPFIKADRYGESNRQAQKSPHISQHDISNNVQNTASNGNHIFPSSLEGLLAAPTPRDYSTFNYQAQYGHGQIPTMGPNIGRSFGTEGGLSALATSRPRPFPPPPPLVRLGSSSRSNMVSSEHSVVPKPPGLYPYLQPSITPAACSPWLTRVFEPDWFHDDQNRMDPTHQPSESASLPDSLSRRLSGEHDQCGAINFASGGHIDGAGSSNFVQNSCGGGGGGRTFRENYDSSCNPGYREERVVPTHRGSPRLTNGPGPPPHYPTPPQSSPLQPPPVPVMDCGPITGLPDIYATRTTPNSVIDLCSPPPSPDTRTAISCSPRGSYVPGNGYHPHIVRLVLVDSRYVPAVNLEPHKHNSALAVPISDVVSKFLRGTSVQSCQVILETVFGLHLYECTSLHLEALAKHKVVVNPESKLVTVPDLRNYLHQLRFLLAEREREKRKDRSCDGHTDTELPLGKRWCESDRES